MSAGETLRLSLQSDERAGFSPFWSSTGPVVLLAVIVLKFSELSAPGLHIQVTSWMFGLLCTWFALAKGAFIRAHRQGASQSHAASSLAFSIWLRSRAPGLAVFAAALLLAAAACDVLLLYRGLMQPEQVRNAVIGFAAMIWLILAPSFLVMSALSAMLSDTTFDEALDLTRGVFSAVGLPWLGVALLAVFLPAGALGLLYSPIRLVLVTFLPSVLTVYFFSVAFYCGLLLFQIAIQARFAAWIAPRLVQVPHSDACGAKTSDQEPAARAGEADALRWEPRAKIHWTTWKILVAVLATWFVTAAALHARLGIDDKPLEAIAVGLAVVVLLWRSRRR